MASAKRKGSKNKLRGKLQSSKSGVSPKSLNANTMTPRDSNQADRDLGKLRGGR